MRTLIKGACIASVDPEIGTLPDADILIEDGRIAAVRPGIEAADAEIIDGSQCIVAPGLVDSHRHLWQGALRAVTADWSFMNYLSGIRMFAASLFRPEDMYAASLHGALEALNAGVTTTADYCHNVNSPDHGDESLRGVGDSGARIVWCYGFNRPPLPAPTFADVDARIEYLQKLSRLHSGGRDRLVTLGVSPEEAPFWPSIGYVERQFAAAREAGARVFMHTNSSRNLFDGTMQRDAERLDDAGLLGPDVVLVHMNHTLAPEWRRVADSGAHVSLTPETELQMCLGWPIITPALEHGINIGFGIDITSNNSADLRVALRLGLQAERYIRSEKHSGGMVDGLALSCADALYWGTMGGAKACGLEDEIGSITPGKAADIVLYRADDVSLVGWDRKNPASAIVLHAGVDTVDTVLVRGKIVKRHGRLTGPVLRACALLRDASDHVHDQVERRGGFSQALRRGLAGFSEVSAGRATGS